MTLKDLRPALRGYLLDDPAIASTVAGRVFPLVLKQGEINPSIVYTRISGTGDHHMRGPTGLNQPRYQIDAWAPSLDAAMRLADLVKERLDGFAGETYGIDIQGAFFVDEREDFDADAKMYRVSRDFMIWFEEK